MEELNNMQYNKRDAEIIAKVWDKNCEKPMKEQMKLLEEEFINWLGNYEQIDDVIIFGVRV